MKTIHTAVCGLALAVAACTTVSADEREALLGKPVNCEVAEQDIADLQTAMPSRRERAGSVVRTVTPVGAVASVATGSYRDRAAVLTGRTENELSARIEEIEQTCGLDSAEDADA
ncbi:hypothetical protein ABWI01_10745 [Oceanicaulis alexandrii]|uniref:hypothetical protein n=1 Tax=Oceanicaulis alexandrii TaxID=153233 RepID=UPI0035D10A7D